MKSGGPYRESGHRQILLFAALLACKSGSGKARSEIDRASLAPAQLICASATYDFGDVLQGDRLSQCFLVPNEHAPHEMLKALLLALRQIAVILYVRRHEFLPPQIL